MKTVKKEIERLVEDYGSDDCALQTLFRLRLERLVLLVEKNELKKQLKELNK